ncbi:MAG: sterol desaturase family protein [Actinomycetota bacterium]
MANTTHSDVDAPYVPSLPIEVSPLFDWPPRPVAMLAVLARSFFGPILAFHIALAVVVWEFLTPSLATMAEVRPGWVALIWLRNAALLTLCAGGLHLLLYRRRAQGQRFKFTTRWLAVDSAKFTGRVQVLDNMAWSLLSGVTLWTAFEVVTWNVYANDRVALRSWSDSWPYLASLVVLLILWSQLHFYVVHRFLHWEPMYRTAHSLHHRNVTTGPWSGISMHPVEHALYFSAAVALWVVPGHPVAALVLLLFGGISPAFSHAGFERVELFGRVSFRSGDYHHHLHHRYFECNYGNRLVPLDVLFGTNHDGTPEAHEQMKARRRSDQSAD